MHTDPATTPTPAIADTRDPRDARIDALDAEARTLARQLAEARVEATGNRAACVEAEHQRNVLSGALGREVMAALVAAIPARVANVLTGAQHIDEAMQRALGGGDRGGYPRDSRDHWRTRAIDERSAARVELARVNALLSRAPARGSRGAWAMASRAVTSFAATQAAAAPPPAPDPAGGPRPIARADGPL
jgi:hypothetical protein